MKIGNVEIKGKTALAPMAGVTDRAFREVCLDFGAAYVTTEMVSAKGLVYGDKDSDKILQFTDRERPIAIQLFGSEPEFMAKAAKLVLDRYSPDIIDINMGCPAPKITKGGSGSKLMTTPELATEVLKSVVNVSTVPVSVKMRTGWDEENINAAELAKEFEKEGAAAITVHGRTKVQMYSPPIDFETIANVKKSVKIPVIANGGIKDIPTACEMFEKTGCDLIMIGQGALGRPWVFSEIENYFDFCKIMPEPPVESKMLTMIKHIEKMCEYKGEYIAVREGRKHAAWYTKGLPNSASYRRRCNSIKTLDELRQMALSIIKEQRGYE